MNPPECIQETRRVCGVWPVLLLAAVGVALYWGTLPAPFIFDDAVAIVNNPSIREASPAVLAAPRNTPTAGRPVVNATLAVNYALGGLDVRGYHAVNIAIHVLCALVLYGIVRRTLNSGGTAEGATATSPVAKMTPGVFSASEKTPGVIFAAADVQSRRHFGPVRMLGRFTRARSLSLPRPCHPVTFVAFATALLWLIHPLQSECVSYVTQRSESIMALFFLLTLYAAIRRWTGIAIVACALGMASKESMVTAPLLVVLYDWAYRDEPWRRVLARRRGLYAGLAATWIVLLVLLVSGPRSDTVGFGHGVTAWQYGLNQCVVVIGYLGRAVWPQGLLLDYGFPRTLTVIEAAPHALVLIGLIGVTGVLLRTRPRLGYPAAWFFLVLAPTSSFVPIATEVAADRRVYLALAGVAVLAVAGGWSLIETARARMADSASRRGRSECAAGARYGALKPVLLAVTVAALSTVTWRRAEMYRRPVTLWEQAAEAVPRNHRAQTNLAVALAAEGRYAEATVRMLRALALDPGSTITADNLAALLAAGAAADR